MHKFSSKFACGLIIVTAMLVGCSAPAAPIEKVDLKPALANLTTAELPTILVHKTPSCGCCVAWVEHLKAAGFKVQLDELTDLTQARNKLGVPDTKASCHTAEVAGYVVEGHVPAADIKRLIEEKPKAKGLVLPGMPIGSPGMETPDGHKEAFTVERLEIDGTTTPYAKH